MSPSFTPPQSPDPSSRAGRHQHTAKPLNAALDRVGLAVVDDDDNVHVLVKDILDRAEGFQWVGSYSSGEAALAGIPQSGAQVVLMDITMPGMSGIECARRLKALLPHLIVVMVTGVDDRRTINLTRECGADAFLAKPFTAGQFLATLLYCIPKSEALEQQRDSQHPQHLGLRGASLTSREKELMRYVAEGLLNKEIAERMGVSIYVIHKLQSSAFKKLGARNRAEAIRNWRPRL